ncbi:MAG: hypothetical protein ACRC9Y_17655 [Aeromonas veronii]
MSLAQLLGIGEVDSKQLRGVNLVDFSQLVISTMMATFKPDEKITVDFMRSLCLNTLRANVIKNKQRYPTIVVCVDNSKDGYWRRDFAYYYKKNRAEKREESDWDWDTIFEGMATVVQELKDHMPYIVIDLPKTEADDAIGVLCKHIVETSPACQILITSSDGDFTQTHKYKQVKQWSPMMKKWVTCKHGSPRNDLRFKIVKGDKKDNVASINARSDYYYTQEEGERAKAISTKKLLDPVLASEDPLSLLDEAQKARYIENEILLDFDKIPDNIRTPIIDQFENGEVAPRRKIYPYFVSKKLIKLIDSINDF